MPSIANLWWVIPGRLAGMSRPEPAELPALQAAGVGAIVSLMDDPSNLDAYRQAKIPFLWLPITGGTAPSRSQLQELQIFVEAQNQLGQAVAVHCSSGRRRTGTMLAALLIGQGMTDAEALQVILTANPEVELRSAQLNFLQALTSG